MNSISLQIIIITFFLGLYGCEQPSKILPSGKTVKIGIIMPKTGDHAITGNNSLIGIKVAMEIHPYLDDGDKIELIIEDDGDNPAQTIKALKKLTHIDQVSAILMLSNSNLVLAVTKLAESYYRTPIISVIATHPYITRRNSLISQLVVDNKIQGEVAALYIRDELLIARAAVFNETGNANSTYLAREFIRTFESVDGVITDTVHLPKIRSDYDYIELLTRIRKNNPEILYLPLDADLLLKVVTAARKLEWNPKIMASDGLLANVLARHENKLDLINGILATDFFGITYTQSPFGKKALEIIQSRYHTKGTSHSALGAEAYLVLLNALNRCANHRDIPCINKMIRSTSNLMGVQSKIAIGPTGKADRPLFINTIVKDNMNFVVVVY